MRREFFGEVLTLLALLITILLVPPAAAATQVFYVDIAAGADSPAGGTAG
jgi:hypothetical protein